MDSLKPADQSATSNRVFLILQKVRFTFLLCCTLFCNASYSQLIVEPQISLGDIESAYEIRGTSIVKNASATKLYLLRADADNGVKIQTSKKTLLPGDTALLSIWFAPEKSGRFNKKISLVHSQSAKPETIFLSGNLIKFLEDSKTVCFYFGEKNTKPVSGIAAVPLPIPAAVGSPSLSAIRDTIVQELPKSEVSQKPVPLYTGKLPETEYKPNNIIFLVDVSSSMRDSLKLPLMKNALQALINELREVDRITFITYADTIKVLVEACSSNQKETLLKQVEALKAKGMTKGRKAILFSQQLAQKHFIAGGNNQIIIATDGEFKFVKEDQKVWNRRQGSQPIVISTVAFGSEPSAIKNLKSLARKGNGSFIQVRNKEESKTKIMAEIQQRSKIDNR